jgi:DNA end-binding protein Ku
MASTVWRGYISFGLISIPVRLFRAARPERVGLRRMYRAGSPENREADDEEQAPATAAVRAPELSAAKPFTATPGLGRRAEVNAESPAAVPPPAITPFRTQAPPVLTPVKQVSVRSGSDEVLSEQAVVKGYEYEKGRFVALDREELKSVAPKTSSAMEIEEFVALKEVDPVYFETSYYLSPEEAGEKAYALLYRAMQTTGLVAVAQFAMHSREHVVILRPGQRGLLAHTMFFASEVRADEEFRAETSAVADKELKLAETLIQSLTTTFEPAKYRDTYRERLESMIAKKVEGQPITTAEPVARPAAVVDIADALRRSLANLKKPVTSDQESRKPEAAAPPRARKSSRTAGGR